MTIDRDKLRELAQAATPAPWAVHHHEGYGWVLHSSERAAFVAGEWREEDGDFIAAADPATVLALLDALDRRESVAIENARRWGEVEQERDELRTLLGEAAKLMDGQLPGDVYRSTRDLHSRIAAALAKNAGARRSRTDTAIGGKVEAE